MKKILLVADEPGWAFSRHCIELKKRLTEYKVDIAYHRQDIKAMSVNFDCVYILDPMPLRYPPPEKTILGLRCDWFHLDHPRGAKGMYEEGFMGSSAPIKGRCCIFHAVNKNQFKAFEPFVDVPFLLVQHGVDEECFDRSKYNKPKNEVLTVGTSGRHNSRNKKGFELVDEACRSAGVRHYATRYRGKITKEQMPEFYNKLDVYVCMSEKEGLHNPTLEAGAMGVPVISTRCGAAEEMIRDGENGLLINRNVNALVEALEELKDEKLRLEMGENFYQEIMKNWTWKVKIEDFRKMFGLFFERSR